MVLATPRPSRCTPGMFRRPSPRPTTGAAKPDTPRRATGGAALWRQYSVIECPSFGPNVRRPRVALA
jgi:hypothetical protein